MPRPADPTLRERLIDAATTAFAAHGYRGASLAAIGARAGVTKGGVYFHFAGKEELFYAVLDHWRDRRRRSLQVQAAGDDPELAVLVKELLDDPAMRLAALRALPRALR